MTRALLPLLLATACGTASVKLDDPSGTADDTGVGGDTAADTDTADTEDTDVEPVFAPDYSVYDATRNFYYDQWGYSCDDTVYETGFAIDAGSGDFQALAELCGDCDYFYEVTPDVDQACDWISLGTTWRGVVLGDGEAELYFFRENDGELEEYAADDGAALSDDGAVLDYAYEIVYDWGYEVTIDVSGTVTWELVEQE